MRMMHPSLPPGQFAETDLEAFERVWEVRGWELAPDIVDISALTVDQVMDDVVDGDPIVAAVALADEIAGRARKTLIERLTQAAAEPITEPDPDDPADTGNEES